MAYDDVLAERVRELTGPDMREKTVFGARCWLVDGNMAYGVVGDDLLVRLPPDDHLAVNLHGFDPMASGKPMKGWFTVPQEEVAEDAELLQWLGVSGAFARTLPPK